MRLAAVPRLCGCNRAKACRATELPRNNVQWTSVFRCWQLATTAGDCSWRWRSSTALHSSAKQLAAAAPAAAADKQTSNQPVSKSASLPCMGDAIKRACWRADAEPAFRHCKRRETSMEPQQGCYGRRRASTSATLQHWIRPQRRVQRDFFYSYECSWSLLLSISNVSFVNIYILFIDISSCEDTLQQRLQLY